MLRLLLGVEVVEIAEKLVEAVVRGQHLVAVAEVVLAELAGHVALRLEHRRDRRILGPHALGGAGKSDLGQAGADRCLPGDERGASRRAALLTVPIGEGRAVAADRVDVGRAVAHHAHVVGAQVESADVVAPDHQDVRLARRGGRGRTRRRSHPGSSRRALGFRLGNRRGLRETGHRRQGGKDHAPPHDDREGPETERLLLHG